MSIVGDTTCEKYADPKVAENKNPLEKVQSIHGKVAAIVLKQSTLQSKVSLLCQSLKFEILCVCVLKECKTYRDN